MTASLIRSRYLITNATTAHAAGADVPFLEDGALYQEAGKIIAIGPYAQLKQQYPDAAEFGGTDYLAFPGLVNAHHHGSGLTSLQRGKADSSLERWLFQGMVRHRLDPYLNTLYDCIKMIESGVTCSIHHAYAGGEVAAYLETMEQVLQAHADTGMQVALAIATRDQNTLVYEDDQRFLSRLPAGLRQATAELLQGHDLPLDDYFAIFHTLHERYGDSERVRLLFGPAGLQWCSDELLGRIVETAAATGTGIHLHVVESPYQKQYPLQRYGRTAIAHLHHLGVLGPHTSCAHTVWATEDDLEILADTQASVVHNPSSNLRLGCGIAPVLPMWQKGINVALGMDGTTLNDDNDLFQEIRLCLRLHRPVGLFARHLSAAEGFAMSSVNGAKAALFAGQAGELVVGGRADIVLMNLQHFTPISMFEQLGVIETLLLCGRPAYIDTVFINGRPVLQEGRVAGFDKEAVVAELIAQAQQPFTPTEQKRHALLAALENAMLDFYHDWPVVGGAPFYQINGRTA